ncbi:hypothetical protein D3C87_578000 [compost metagenome]
MLGLRQLRKRADQRAVERVLKALDAGARRGQPVAVVGQGVQARRALQIVAPLRQLVGQERALHALALPACIVKVLVWRRLQSGRLAGGVRIVDAAEVGEQDFLRTGVGGNVMGHQQQHMVRGLDGIQRRANQCVVCEVERDRHRCAHHRLDVVAGAALDIGALHAHAGAHLLPGLPVDVGEGGP